MRSVVNRAYYAAFYSALALFLKADINPMTSKHKGIIALFDKEFTHPGRIDKQYSRIFHRLFDERQTVDYKEFTEVLQEDALKLLDQAKEFYTALRQMLQDI